jgi:hypothetical protein
VACCAEVPPTFLFERSLQQQLIFFVDTSELVFEHVSEEVDGPRRILLRIIGKSKWQVVEKQIPAGFQQRQRQNRILNDEFGFMGAIDIDEIERFGG